MTLWRYDPNTPPEEEPQHIPVGTTYIYPYLVRATPDSGIWEHYKILDYYPTGGQQIPGFKVIREVKNFSDGLWYEEEELTPTWVPN